VAPLLLWIAYLGNPLYAVFIAAATAYAALEVRSMLRHAGCSPRDWLLVSLAALLPLSAWLSGFWAETSAAAGALSGTLPALEPIVVLTIAVILSLAWLVLRPTEHALVDWSVSLAMALYLGGFMLFYLPLRAQPALFPGFWVIALLVLSWVCDSSAFFVGRAYGRTPLAPAISPNKSVEGAVAGVLAPPIVGLIVGALVGVPPLVLGGFGLMIAIGTIVGDLIESLIKRQTGVKDSGVLIPGHGGLLDRMDSLLVCAPLAVLYLRALALVGG
jgi:phosphatidate cytidylyltransferase